MCSSKRGELTIRSWEMTLHILYIEPNIFRVKCNYETFLLQNHVLSSSCETVPIVVVQSMDNAIHWINLYPVSCAVCFVNTYPLDSDLSVEQHYPPFD